MVYLDEAWTISMISGILKILSDLKSMSSLNEFTYIHTYIGAYVLCSYLLTKGLTASQSINFDREVTTAASCCKVQC